MYVRSNQTTALIVRTMTRQRLLQQVGQAHLDDSSRQIVACSSYGTHHYNLAVCSDAPWTLQNGNASYMCIGILVHRLVVASAGG